MNSFKNKIDIFSNNLIKKQHNINFYKFWAYYIIIINFLYKFSFFWKPLFLLKQLFLLVLKNRILTILINLNWGKIFPKSFNYKLLAQFKFIKNRFFISIKYWLVDLIYFSINKNQIKKKLKKKYFSREKFRRFIILSLEASKAENKNKQWIVGNTFYNNITFFNKMLNKYWNLFFFKKLNTFKLGSLVLVLHKWVRWIKVIKIKKALPFNIFSKWILKQLILLIKLPLFKNILHHNFFWVYSNRWHFEVYAWRKLIRVNEPKLLLYFYRFMAFQLNISILIKQFLITTFNTWVLLARHSFSFFFSRRKNWRLLKKWHVLSIRAKLRWKIRKWFRRKYNRLKKKWNRFFKNFLNFIKKKYLNILKFVWLLSRLRLIFNCNLTFIEVNTLICLTDTNTFSNKVFFSLKYKKSLIKLIHFFKSFLSFVPWKTKVKNALVFEFYKIIIFLKLILKNQVIISFSKLLFEVTLKLTAWILRATYWFKYMVSLLNMPWYKDLDLLFKKKNEYKLQKKWYLWRLFKSNIFWFRKGQPIKQFFRYNNILIRYYTFFYSYKIQLLKKNVYRSFISLFESKLDILLYRLGFTKNNLQAKILIKKKQILVNDKKIKFNSFFVSVGSLIRISLSIWGSFLWRIPLGTSGYLKWSIINYIEFSIRLFGGIFFRQPLLGEHIFKKYEKTNEKFYLKWLYWIV